MSARPSPPRTKNPSSYSSRLGVPSTAWLRPSACVYSMSLRVRCFMFVAATTSRYTSFGIRAVVSRPSGSATVRSNQLHAVGVEQPLGQGDLEAPSGTEVGDQAPHRRIAPGVAAERGERRGDVLDDGLDAEVVAQALGAGLGLGVGVGLGHQQGHDSRRAHGLDGQGEADRRVDAAADADDEATAAQQRA